MKLEKTEYVNGILVCKKHCCVINKKLDGTFFCRKCQRNADARAKNQILRDICGTSAAAARRDMGI